MASLNTVGAKYYFLNFLRPVWEKLPILVEGWVPEGIDQDATLFSKGQ
jgi:hypothetical protein